MTKIQLMQEGINLMLAGMGFVLLFLWILILAVGLMSKLINRYLPEPVVTPPSSAAPAASAIENDLSQLRPVIVAAIAHHRRKQGLN